MNVDDFMSAPLPMASSSPSKRQMILDFYEALKANKEVRKLINWERFAREADAVGLHYHKDVGLITKEQWATIAPFIKGETGG